jgi:CheY-like chemotaxis protein
MTTRREPVQANTTILVVEDDPSIRDSVAECLEDEGYVVARAANGAEALDLLAAGVQPQILLLDLHMPVMDGAELVAALEADERLRGIPRVLMTGSAPRAGAPLPPADVYLEKPFEIATLLAAIERHRRAAA